MKTFILALVISLCSMQLFASVYAQEDDQFRLLPEATDADKAAEAVEKLGTPSSSNNFNQIYNKQAKELGETGEGGKIKACAGLGNQFASGIMNRDTILCLAAQVVKFVSNMAMVVGALMIIYAGYMYATSVFGDGNVGKGTEAIKYAIIGIVIVIFSYAIVNLLINAFL